MGDWQIIVGERHLIGPLAGHRIIALVNDQGQTVRQLNGLAADLDPASGQVVHIEPWAGGFGGEELHFFQWISGDPSMLGGEYQQISPGTEFTIKSGSQQAMMNLWNAGIATGLAYNNLHLPYPKAGLGVNSNTLWENLLYGILNTAVFTWADGRTGTVHDVMLATRFAHLSGWNGGTGNEKFTPFPADGELGRAVAPDGIASGKVDATVGQKTPDQDLIFVRADAGDGVEDLPPITPNAESIANLAAAQAGLDGEAPQSAGGVAPIVIDLGGDGFDLVDPMASNVIYDLNRDGWRDRLGWVGAGDAILGLDRDRDGLINVLSEVSFVKDKAGAQTDLEGLSAFDTNNNAALDAGDARFGDFKLWIDANQDGRSSLSELKTLAQAGVVSIGLESAGASPPQAPTGNVVLQTAAVTFEGGAQSVAGDVVLGSRSGLAIALDASRGDPAIVGTPAPGPRFDAPGVLSPWGMNPNVRRQLLNIGAGEESAVGGGGAAPELAIPEDSTLNFGVADSGRKPTPAAPEDATPTPIQLTDGDNNLAEASAVYEGPPLLSRRRERNSRSAGREAAQPKQELSALMQRLSAASVAERAPNALRPALPMNAEAARQVDLLVQARAAFMGANGGEAGRGAPDALAEAKLALPNAWRRDRLRPVELA